MSDDEWLLIRKGQQWTNWYRYNLEELLHAASEAIDSRNWEQIQAWRLMADLCNHHADTLARAAEVLSEHWSPHNHPAAATFLNRLGALVDILRTSATAAAANAVAIDNILTAQIKARDELVRAKQYKTTLRGRQLSLSEINDLDDRARDIMKQADFTVADAHAQLIAPKTGERRDSSQSTPQLPAAQPPSHIPGVGRLAVPAPTTSAIRQWMPVSRSGGTPSTASMPSALMPGDPISHGDWGLVPTLDGGSVPWSGLASNQITDGGWPANPSSAPASPSSIGGFGVGGVTANVIPNAGGAAPDGRGPLAAEGPSAARPPMLPPMTAGSLGRQNPTVRGVQPGGVLGNSYAARNRRSGDVWTPAVGGPAVIDSTFDDSDHDPGPNVIGAAE